jgi:hypothetical protein
MEKLEVPTERNLCVKPKKDCFVFLKQFKGFSQKIKQFKGL